MSINVGNGAMGESIGNDESSSSSIAPSRRVRPPPINTSNSEEGRVPLSGRKVLRKESKGGLRGIFTRNKSEKSVVSPVSERHTPAPSITSPTPLSPKLMSPITSPVGDGFFRKFGTGNATESSSPTTPATPGRATRTPSRLNLRSKSIMDGKTSAKPASKPTQKTSVFDPPPLFQSYPQSVKHARLSALTLSADAIIRMSNHKRNTSLRDEIAQTTEIGPDGKNIIIKHKRQRSGSISKGEWTQKIFVLVTSGYLLQYPGEGNFDRLPEKMIQLGKESVAFASDVIPGKHWVLQVSQSMSADGVPTSDSRSLLSRLAFRSADYRRNATSLLLVLDSAEEMDAWIAVLRKEIETLGGKKQITEIGTVKTEENPPELKSQPSHRYLGQRRGSDQISIPCSPPQASGDRRPSWQQPEGQNIELALPWSTPRERRPSWQPEEQNIEEISLPEPLPRWSLHEAQSEAANRPMTGCASVTNSSSSYEQNLEGFRDSFNRLSYCSSDQRTYISSPATSPTRDSTSTMEDLSPLCLDAVRARPNAAEIVERRRSLQALQVVRDPVSQVSSHLQTPQKPLRQSSYGVSSRTMRSPSPATPNFSVPVSSSKRYSTRSPVAERRPSLPAMNLTMETQKRPKKGPPTALSVARPLSPVMDTTSPKRVPIPAASTETSQRRFQRNRSSTVDTNSRSLARSPIGKLSSKELRSARRVSSFTPSNNALEVRDLDLRRHSSMQAVRQTTPPPMESNGSCVFKFPEPLSPKATQDKPFENIWKNDKESLPTLRESLFPAQPLATLPEIPVKQSLQRRPRSMLASSGHQPPIAEEPSNTPRRKRHSSSFAPTTHSSTLNHKSSYSPGLVSPGGGSRRPISNRRSLPALMHGAPPAPPPDCALPPLPPGSAISTIGRTRGASFVNSRREIGVKV
ncbi:hypothetical protein BofuT4_P123280.1 [Botrytis cinerea T4]|uniref:PH domain-containing protein n=1 Tax=Botryotinia fuckeliana (strain T4) TaxID=999810 RepID=G2YNW1_BOTF4|nr:hypothetical protein BofuT4_P123280.1 [Botrytis cinerea T4]